MGESEKSTHLDIEGFSLIDVSTENDCLISSPQTHPSSEKGGDHKSVKFTEAADTSTMEAMVASFEDGEEGQKSPNSSRPEKKSKGGKYNLRKSLAWDSAFFTSAGVLDPEELSTMIGGEKCSLPGIQEDVSKSCDSLTTLDSETLMLESLEADLFEDIRASIQKTSKASSFVGKKFGVKETQSISMNKVKVASKDKMKVQGAAKKPNCTEKESGRTLNWASVHQQASQPNSKIRELPKAPRGTKQITPVAMTSTKRISSGSKNVETESNAKSATGKRTAMLRTQAQSGPKNVLRRPIIPPKTSLPSTSSCTKELTSCSSRESAGSAISGKNSASSLESVSGRNHCSRSTTSSGSTIRTPSRAASKSKRLTEGSELSIYLKFATVDISASTSPASSISEWSSASSSSTLAVNQRSTAARASLDTGASDKLRTDKDVPHVLDSQHQSASKFSVVNSALPVCSSNEGTKATSISGSELCNLISTKPSGLRLPSPKIGFFDGVRSSSCTPKGSVLSRPAVPNGLPKATVGAVNLKESTYQGNLVKVKRADTSTSVHNSKSGKQTSGFTKSKTLPEESPNGGQKISGASKNIKSISVMPPEVENKLSPKSGGGSCSNADQVGYEGSDLDIESLDSLLVEKNETGSRGLQKHVGCVKSTGFAELRSNEIPSFDGRNEEACDSSSNCVVKPSAKTVEDERCKLFDTKGEFHSLCDSNGKEQLPSEGQVARLAKMFGAVDINKGAAPNVFEVTVDKPISPVTNVATTRILLTPKDSACNTNETLDVSIPESLLQDNS